MSKLVCDRFAEFGANAANPPLYTWHIRLSLLTRRLIPELGDLCSLPRPGRFLLITAERRPIAQATNLAAGC